MLQNTTSKYRNTHNRKNYDYINGDSTITESEKFTVQSILIIIILIK